MARSVSENPARVQKEKAGHINCARREMTFPAEDACYLPGSAGASGMAGAALVASDGTGGCSVFWQPTIPTVNATSTIRVNSLFIVGVKMDESGQRTREFFNFFSNARFAKFPP